MDSYYDTPRPVSQEREFIEIEEKCVEVSGYYDSPKSNEAVKEVEEGGFYDSPRSSPKSSVVKKVAGEPVKRVDADGEPENAELDAGYYDTPRQHRSGGDLSVLSSTLETGYYDVPKTSLLSLNNKTSNESLNDGPSPKQGSSNASIESENHFGVNNTEGGRDIYARPSFRLKPKTLLPPDLPPRNSPRQSKLVPLMDSSPDYVDVDKDAEVKVILKNKDEKWCERCKEVLDDKTKIVNSNGSLYHPSCFVCAQCFQPFKDGLFFMFEDRRYCEHDFQILFAPCCAKCSEFIVGRVIKALSGHWHPSCLTCDRCSKPVADTGFSKYNGRAVCGPCSVALRSEGRHICRKCHAPIEGEPLRVRGDLYHPHHFNCTSCGVELTSTAREVRSRPGVTANLLNELYCLRCHDKMNIPICGACRRPIEERVVTALGKHWHVEHFVCAKCEKPFLGHRHYERQGLAYCETHYHQLFGNLCHVCDSVIQGDVFTALNKAWCVSHFSCSSCDKKMTAKTKFFEVDLKPVCKNCYEKYPRKSKLQLKKYHEMELLREQRSLTTKNEKLANIFRS